MMGPAGDGTSPVTTHPDPLEDAGTTASSCVLSQDFQPLVSFRNRTSLNSEGRSKDLLWGFILQKDHYVPPQSPPDDAIENFNLHCSCPNLCFWVFWGHLQPPSAPFLLDEKIKVLLDFGHKIQGYRSRRYHEHCTGAGLHHSGSSLGCSFAVSVL